MWGQEKSCFFFQRWEVSICLPMGISSGKETTEYAGEKGKNCWSRQKGMESAWEVELALERRQTVHPPFSSEGTEVQM